MNAKKEFQRTTKDQIVVCANIYQSEESWDEESPRKLDLILRVGHTDTELNAFLDKLDFYYDSGYGTQELFGLIYTTTHIHYRHEYDGSESWSSVALAYPVQCMS